VATDQNHTTNLADLIASHQAGHGSALLL